ncbi:MAG: hypothetical protein HQK65_01865, partial [Desulfamplus sp.]|nr:hypothetical protein [Desulfamplus sp.]
IAQTADGALDESINIVNIIKTKAIQASQDGQTYESRKAIQSDIDKLRQELDLIARSTSFNGQKLLSGGFSNKQFQVGAYTGETVQMSINSSESTKIGHTTTSTIKIKDSGYFEFSTNNIATNESVKIESFGVLFDNNPEHGLGVFAEKINKFTESTSIKAVAIVESNSTISSGQTGEDFKINGILIGDIPITKNDRDGSLVKAINNMQFDTGVIASTGADGQLTLKSIDGRALKVEGLLPPEVIDSKKLTTHGSLTMIKTGFNDFEINQVRAPNTLYTNEIPNDPNIHFNSVSKHYYEIVSSANIEWSQAKELAEDRTWQGMNGYLATVSSSQENQYIYDMLTDHAWIGASDKDVEGEWRWETGPEGLEDNGKGQLFWSGNQNGSPVNDVYNNWIPNQEPNDASGSIGEDYGYIICRPANSRTSYWNDYPNSSPKLHFYAVEYGGMPGDPEIVEGEPPNMKLDEIDKKTQTLNDIKVTSFDDAQIAIELTDASIKDIDKIRSNLGSTQNQLESTLSNIATTSVNIAASESTIRDLDISEEMGQFSKLQILVQSGTYALSQANKSSETVMNLLQ